VPGDAYGLTLNGALERNRAERPAKPFILAHETALTYADVSRLVAGFAGFLRSSGVGPGDRVAMVLPRVPELIICFLGAVRIGAVPVPVNYTVSAEDVRRFVAATSPAVTVVHEKLLRQHRLDPWGQRSTATVVVGKEIEGCIPWRLACAASDGDPRGESAFGEVAYLNYTTGSTGMPKGALATHANIASNTRSAVEVFGFTSDDVHLCMFASFAHPHELFARALFLGGTIVLLEEINPKIMARTIRDRGVTAMMGLAPMYDMLISHCADADLGRLRIAESGGMYTRPDIIENFRRHFGIPVLSVWGSTETTGIALANTPAEYRADGSAGKACPHYGVRVVDEAGRDVGDDEVGELVFSGPGVVAGYVEDLPFPRIDGWYRSGDLARRDAAGYHYFVERKTGLLKVAGMKVYPLQIEQVLQSHPSVKEAAVIGVTDRLRGAVPKAFLVAREGRRIDTDALLRFCRGRLPHYMVPREVQVVEDMPRIGSGKVDKRALARVHSGADSVSRS
jgi:acyl-coenzyme A synthetase/AMP-(fatty) acid ligase